MKSASPVMVFAGGGTGGHVFPAIAVAEAVLKIVPDARVSFAGSRDKIEATQARRGGYEFDAIWISGFRRRLSLDTFVFPLKLIVSLVQSLRIIRRRRPDVVVGSGGYVSGPVVWAGSLLGCRSLILEQNEFPGVTTRLLAARADEVHIAFESTRALLPRARKVVVAGNPVRSGLTRISAEDARRRFGLSPDRGTVLVFGGSQGASSINRAVAGMLARFRSEGVQLIWQTGRTDYESMHEKAGSAGDIAVREFIDDMNAAYSAATLVVCRAGATSIAEITALGKPSVLIPYPHAAGDHQRRNARALEISGAARVVDETEIAKLERVVFSLLSDKDSLTRIAEASGRMGRPEAAAAIAHAVLRLASLKPSKED